MWKVMALIVIFFYISSTSRADEICDDRDELIDLLNSIGTISIVLSGTDEKGVKFEIVTRSQSHDDKLGSWNLLETINGITCITLTGGSGWARVPRAHEHRAIYLMKHGGTVSELLRAHMENDLDGLTETQRLIVIDDMRDMLRKFVAEVSPNIRHLFGFRGSSIDLVYPGDLINLEYLFRDPELLDTLKRHAVKLAPGIQHIIATQDSRGICVFRETILQELAREDFKTRIAVGFIGRSVVDAVGAIEIFVALDGSWTYIKSERDGYVCSAREGKKYDATERPLGPIS